MYPSLMAANPANTIIVCIRHNNIAVAPYYQALRVGETRTAVRTARSIRVVAALSASDGKHQFGFERAS